MQVRSIDAALATAEAFVVAGDLKPGMVDADLPAIDRHADLCANQLPRHAVMFGVDVHAGVVLDTPGQLAQLTERRTAAQRTQGLPLLALEPRDRRLARGPVHPRVSHLTPPPGQMRLQRTPRCKAPPGDAVVLDVADAALVLALGARSVIRLVQRDDRLEVQPLLAASRDPTRRINAAAIGVEQQRHHHRRVIGRIPPRLGVGAHDCGEIELLAHQIADQMGRMTGGDEIGDRRRQQPNLVSRPGAKHFAHAPTESSLPASRRGVFSQLPGQAPSLTVSENILPDSTRICQR